MNEGYFRGGLGIIENSLHEGLSAQFGVWNLRTGIFSLALISGVLQGCSSSTTASLFPVEGPLSKSNQPVSIVAKVGGIFGNSGPFEVVLPVNIVCKGKWSSVAPTFSESSNVFLLTKYGSISGTSQSSGIVPGANKGQAYAQCSDGNSLNAEFVTGSGTANGYGFAEDKKGNVFKLIF
jgi:hypothetical protein